MHNKQKLPRHTGYQFSKSTFFNWKLYSKGYGCMGTFTDQLVLSKHLKDNQNVLFKTGDCLIQVHFNVFAFLGNEYMLA